jgi:hypothetical protein
MPRPQQMRAIDKGLVGEQGEGFGLNLDDPLASETAGADMIAGQLLVRGVVLAERKQLVKVQRAHRRLPPRAAAGSRFPQPRQARRLFCKRVVSAS